MWNGRSVPEVLLSGNHSAIAAWRHEQRLARTASRRPDLLHPAQITTDGGLEVDLRPAVPADVPELFTLTKACWVQEAVVNDRLDIPPLHESIEELRASLDETRTRVARSGGRLVGSVRTSVRGDDLFISRLMVAPDLQGRGLGRRLLALAEQDATAGTRTISLLAGARSADNLRMYRRAGYRPVPGEPPAPGAVELVKRRRG